MTLTYNTKHFPDLGLILEYFEGEMTLDNFIAHNIQEAKKPDYKLECSTLSDISNLSIIGLTSDISNFVQFSANHGLVETNKKSAILWRTPNQQIYANLYAKLCLNHKLEVKVFSKMKDALEWLNAATDITKVKETFQQLKSNKSKLSDKNNSQMLI